MISLKTKPYPKIKVKINTGFIFIGESTERAESKDEVRGFLIRKNTTAELFARNKVF